MRPWRRTKPAQPLISPGNGTIVLNEMILPIVDIFLDDEGVHVVGKQVGPLPAGSASMQVVCDRSGRAVYSKEGAITWPSIPAGGSLTFETSFRIIGKTVHPDVP